MLCRLDSANHQRPNNSTGFRRSNRVGRPLVQLRALTTQKRGNSAGERWVAAARSAGVFNFAEARINLVSQCNQVGIHVTSP